MTSKRYLFRKITLIFLHIMKTGGSSVDAIIRTQYKPNQFFKNPTLYNPNNKMLLFCDHSCFGSHEDRISVFPYTYFTIIREPVARTLSQYGFLRQTLEPFRGNDDIYRFLCGLDPQDETNGEHIRLFNNYQTRQVAGIPISPTGATRALTEDDYNQAILNLDQYFSFVITTDRLNQHWDTLFDRFEYPRHIRKHLAGHHHINKTHEQYRVKNIDQNTLELIEHNNQFDTRLYNYVCEHMDHINTRPLRLHNKGK